MKLIILLTLFTLNLVASENYFCGKYLESLPVQAGGRVKPYYVLATETIKHITGESKLGDNNATNLFCVLSLESMGLKNSLEIPIRVDHIKVKELLGLDESAHSIEVKRLLPQKQTLRSEYMGQKQNDAYKKDLNKVLSRLGFYEKLTAGELWTLPEIKDDAINWVALPFFLTEDKVNTFKQDYENPFEVIFLQAKDKYIEIEPDSYLIELTYAKARLFTWAMLSVLLGIILLVSLKKNRVGVLFVALTISLELTAMIMRIIISGRAPITNMYETVMFSGFGALVLSVIIFSFKKDKLFLIGGLSYNLLCLLMMKFANNMLDPSIQTLVPVLRDNFWLSTHVTTIILSYAALALSWILANIVLLKSLKGKIDKAQTNYYIDLIYTCMKFGVVLLSAGIILGGVWADYSWGRFWGWDPKETWSLIVLLIYMAILHGKYTKWVSNKNFIPLVAGAFLSVMMAWFGVNYILATGLHSYGFSEGGAIFLMSFFAIQLFIIGTEIVKKKIIT